MRHTFVLGILCCILFWPLDAQVNVQDTLVTYHAKELTLGDVLKEISDKYAIQFFYSASKIPVDQRISVDVDNQPLYVLLDKIKALTSINYRIDDAKIILFAKDENSTQQHKFSLYGFVEDSLTGERLIGAYIIVKDHSYAAVSNAYGYYSLTLQEGKYIVKCSYVGYKPVELYFNSTKDLSVSFKLKPEVQQLQEIKVSDKLSDHLSSVKMGCDEVPLNLMRTYPALLGENDPIQFLKMLPGIQSNGEASDGLYVRGSPPNQTSYILDDATLFNISHFSELFSSINPDAIKDIQIYKSQIPAQYGGVLASVIDLRLRDGNNQHYSASGGIGTIASRLTIEGPIVKNKASFIISARRSYLDALLKLFNHNQSDVGKFYFYDINGKLNYSINNRNRIYLSAYLSKDVFEQIGGTNWTNSMLSFRWNHVYNSKLFSNVTLTGSKYVQQLYNDDQGYYNVKTNWQNYAFKYDLSYFPTERYQFNVGFNTSYQVILPVKVTVQDNSSIIAPYYSGILDRSLYNVYFDGKFDLTNAFNLEAGARLNYLFNYSESLGSPVLKPEPFFTTCYKILPSLVIKAGYSRNYQFYQGQSLVTMIIPFDRIIFTDDILKPQYSDNLSMGGYYNTIDNQFKFSLEGYYKWLYNQYHFTSLEDLLLGKDYKDIAISGNSKAYGIECSARKLEGRFTGMVSYTLAKVLNQENDMPGGFYAPFYDRRHNFSINLDYKLSERFNLSATWCFMSGSYFNMPIGKYEVDDTAVPMFSFQSLQKLRMPPYHHLDLGLQYKFGHKSHFKHSLELSLYNVYFRKNLLYYTYRYVYEGNVSTTQDQGTTKSFDTVGFYLFQFVPSLSYEFKFD